MSDTPLCLCSTVWVHLCPEHVPSSANPYARVRTLTAALLQVTAERDALRDQLQASQCAEAMLTDEVRGLKEQRDSLRADAMRYRWLKTRINWEDTVRRYGELSTCRREWTHIDVRHKSERPLSENIDEYIDAATTPPLPDTKERG